MGEVEGDEVEGTFDRRDVGFQVDEFDADVGGLDVGRAVVLPLSFMLTLGRVGAGFDEGDFGGRLFFAKLGQRARQVRRDAGPLVLTGTVQAAPVLATAASVRRCVLASI